MKKSPVVFIIFFLIAAVSHIQAQDSVAAKSIDSLRNLNQSAFSLGERLVYDVGYSFITAGEAVFSIPAIDTIHGSPCYQVLFTVVSTPTFSFFYKVDDRYETMIDKKGIFPWRFTQRIREGKYKHDFSAEFDQLNRVAFANDKQYPIPQYVHDAVSAMYYVRTIDFAGSRPGDRFHLQNFYKDTTYLLAVKFLGNQRIEVEAGTFDCILVEPLMQEGGLFKNEGHIIIWMTNDERKIPVKVSTEVAVGSIDAELREYSGINGQIKAKVE